MFSTQAAPSINGRCFLLRSVAVIFTIFTISFIGIRGQEEVIAEVGTNASLNCISSGRNSIWWSFNGQNITKSTKRYAITTTQIGELNGNGLAESLSAPKSSHTLTVRNVQFNDKGNFTCHNAKTELMTDTEITYFLQPILSPKIVRSNSQKLHIKISQSVILYCLVEAYPITDYQNHTKWYKEDETSVIDLQDRTVVRIVNTTHVNATLELADVSKKENGSYVCSVSSVLTNSELKREISLLVLDVPQVSIDFLKAVGSSKIFLNWTVNDGNDQVQQYFIQHTTEGSTAFTYYNHPIDGKNTSYVLGSFQPNTSYQLRISGKNSLGQGPPYTHPQWVRTLETDPIFIPKIEVKGSTHSTITIGWTPPPPDLLEYIQYYELVVSEANDNSEIVEEAFYPQNSRNLPYMFDNLRTATEYVFKVRACSGLTELCWDWSEIVNGSTMDGISSEPLNIRISCSHFNISRRNIVGVAWDDPKIPNGKITSYQLILDGLSLFRSEGLYRNETWGPKIKSVYEKNKAEFEGVLPNTNYTVRVSGVTRSKKPGKVAEGHCTMPVTVPDNIGKIMWVKVNTDDDRYVFKLFLPRISERNGQICCYRIYLVRMNDNSYQLPSPEDIELSNYHEAHSVNSTSKNGAYLAEMFPGDDYRHEIILGDGRRMADKLTEIKSDQECRKCFDGAEFKKPFKKIVKTTTTTTTTESSEDALPIVPEISQREKLNKAGNLTQAASKILENKRRRRQPDEEAGQSAGNADTEINVTPALPPALANPEIFDGQLNMSNNYTGFVEVVVRNNNADSNEKVLHAYSNYFEIISPAAVAENLNNVNDMSAILSIVVQVLCGLILLVLVLLASLCFMHRYYSKHANQGEEVISLRDSLSRALCGGRTSNHRHLIGSSLAKPTDIGPISKHDLPQAYINRHKDTDYGFLREYELLPNRFNDRTTKNSDQKENAHKNRYPDIKAYDQTRVKLSMMNAIQGSDYINANFVIGYKERKKFICAQGPMESTISDFWRMIWEQHLEIIVMLTNLEEYNKAKCAKYWPEKTLDSEHFGDIVVTFASEQRYSDYLVRNLDISRRTRGAAGCGGDEEEERRQITQFHYLVWKDFMAPEHPHGIIKFIRQINAVYSVQRGPILVHCSAGVGRTGTLVALDSLMQQLDEEGQIAIFNTVCDLRHQRNFLVQSLKQYIFLYRALLDIAQFSNTELLARGLSAAVENLKIKPNDSREKCKLEVEFEKIKSITDEANKSCAVGSGDENMSKNRNDLVIPFDRNRVILTPIPTREHSTYINASFIEGYDNSESFIITQDPMENTIGDFWRLISEQGINTLVMISEIGDGPSKCPRYWADDEIQYDHILVKYMDSESCPYYTRREFNVTNCKIDDTIKVTQFQYNGWPTVDGEVPEVCRGIIELVDQAQKHHHSNENNFSTPSPIVVHCSIGTDRSSIFVAMCILVQQLRTEKKVDICTTARKLRSQRAMQLNTYAQYEFLHRAIVNYADLHNLSLESPTDC